MTFSTPAHHTTRLFRYFSRSIAVPLAVGTALCTCTPQTSPEPRQPTNLDLDGIKTEEGTLLSTETIGVLFADKISSAKVQALIKEFGWEPQHQYSEWLGTFRLGQTLSPEQLWELGAKLKTEHAVIRHAGVVEWLLPGDNSLPPPMQVHTQQVIAQFAADVSEAEVKDVARDLSAAVVARYPYAAGQYLIQVSRGQDPRQLAKAVLQKGARWAHNNFLLPVEERDVIPTDPYFRDQWFHINFGYRPGLGHDADVDTTRAWDFGAGVTTWPTVAVLELGGMDTSHPDYIANVVDQKNFSDCTESSTVACATGSLEAGWHGTPVAGLVAAADNDIGVVGACPECKLMLLQPGGDAWAKAMAFDYAHSSGADILSNSWGLRVGTAVPDNLRDAIQRAATDGRSGLGSTVFFALPTTGSWKNRCSGGDADISAFPFVVGVGPADDGHERPPAGYGDCMDVLGPSDGGVRMISSTDVVGPEGGNNTVAPCTGDYSDQDYTNCFGGTSAATPIVAGAAALALAERPSLTALQLGRLMRDTADKIDPAVANYNPLTGFSEPTASPDPSDPSLPVGSLYAFGRINAYDAVRIVGTIESGGNRGVDVFLRDNYLDWGNQEQWSTRMHNRTSDYVPYWESPDIKIDAPPFEMPGPTAQTFDAFPDEAPTAGTTNYVYLRLRNRGPDPATGVAVRMYWSRPAAALPELPLNFWALLPTDLRGDWNSLRQAFPTDRVSVPYSGASVAGTAEESGRIVRFELDAPEVDPESLPAHFCLIAITDAGQDRMSAASRPSDRFDAVNVRDNNVAQRNMNLVLGGSRLSFPMFLTFWIFNSLGYEATMTLDSELLKGWKASIDGLALGQPFMMKAGERRQLKVRLEADEQAPKVGNLRFIQKSLDPKTQKLEVLGGITYRFVEPKTEQDKQSQPSVNDNPALVP